MSERTLVIADAHLGSVEGDGAVFLSFLEREAKGVARLVLLGDLFDLWLGSERLQTPGQRRVVEALRGLRRQGLRLWYVEGNRDYFLGRIFSPDPFEAVAPEQLDLQIGGRRVRFEHGDRINVRDRNYQAWRRFSRSAGVAAAFNLIPPGAAVRLAAWLERRFRTTNARHRVHFPEDLCRARARQVFAEGPARLFLGHFHRGWEWGETAGGRACRAVVVPAWHECRAGWIYDPAAGEDRLNAPGAAASSARGMS